LITQLSEGFKLNPKGEKEVKRIIANMEDEKADAGFAYWEKSVSAPTKKTRLRADDLSKIKEWAQGEVDLEKLNVRDLKTGLDYALVAIWIVTTRLKKVKAVRWSDAYYYFKERYTTISATPNAFRKALISPSNEKYFGKSDELFYLKTEGESIVKDMIAGKRT